MRSLFAALALVLFALTIPAQADTFPSRTITLIVPYPPGGSTDVAGRILAGKMGAALGQPVIVENVGGAGGSIGMGRLARSAPDGYTIDIGQSDTHVGSIIYNLNAAMVQALANPAVRPRFAELGLDVASRAQQTPEALGSFTQAEIDKWWPIIEEFGIRGE
jgi:tripartite-type tricarboxylate transporter receptor subunit TctC